SSKSAHLATLASALRVRHPHRHQRRVFLRADGGHLVLQGRVKSFFEKQMAQEALRTIDGVRTIDNQLEVSWQD
ncbi:MAG: BON domain-containing protein, partial [Planctomycetota bacterium]